MIRLFARPSQSHPPSYSAQRRFLPRLWAGFVCLLVLSLAFQPLSLGYAGPSGQEPTAQEKARQLLESLTPEERVGQLFLVTFNGTEAGPGTPIYELITRYHIGGVVLLAENDNFTVGENAPEQLLSLNRQLQLDKWNNSQQTLQNPITGESYTPQFIPLLIGISQEGDGYPYSQFRSGVTPLPNQMALGATFNPDLARQVGAILGRELKALGFNLLLGPSLDVLETPHTEGSTDLGTRTFGGDPFWVAEMGRAFVEGVHNGSQNQIAVVAKYFPGHGAADRLPEEEVATVRKSLNELRDFDMTPFFAVTGENSNPQSQVEGLLASHIRYQGFQGSNIRPVTRPVTFDSQAFSALLELEPLKTWHAQGGVMITDNLGSRAVRRYYDLNNQTFQAHRVAQNALLAGNDLLYMADFSSPDRPDSAASAMLTLEYFAQKYREDPFFQARVDASVLRILTLKFKLYSNFSFTQVIGGSAALNQVGTGGQVTLEVAQEAATLISPSIAELTDTMPDPPDRNDQMVFITDTQSARQCSGCPVESVLGLRAMEEVILRRFGPQGSGQVNPNNLISFSIADLNEVLKNGPGESPLELELNTAHWIVFAMGNPSRDNPSYTTLTTFLDERPDLFQQKRLIVFAFGAPYYLDATSISKLSAYYGLYSKAPQFLEVASYLLFRELTPLGHLPVSIPGVYDLNQALFPDPDQVIQLQLDLPGQEAGNTTATPMPVTFQLGDIIPVRTGVILDHNGHPVPDGTPVTFILDMGGEAGAPTQIETTINGIARTAFQATNPGVLEIRAESETARQSNILRFDIQAGSIINLPPTPTDTPTPTPTPTETPTPTPTATEPATSGTTSEEPPTDLDLGDWLIALLITAGIALAAYRLAAVLGQIRWGLRGAFLSLIGGLLAYSYLALRLPGAEDIMQGSVARAVILVTLFGAALGLGITWLWRQVLTGEQETLLD